MKPLVMIFSIAAVLFGAAAAQKNSIDRKYVPILQSCDRPLLLNLRIDEWTAFRYNADRDEWQAVPFQFDKLDKKGKIERFPSDSTDATDELAVMPEHLGDRAAAWQWLADPASQTEARIELEFSDPLDSGKRGWLYLYRRVGSKPALPQALRYSPGPADAPAADTIKTDAFTLGHNRNGWMDYLALGSDRTDLIDRFKLRLAGKMFIGPAYDINEDYVESQTGNEVVFFIPGPVRAFHIIKANFLLEKLKLPLLPKRSTFDYHFHYFPNSFKISAETDLDAAILSIFGVQLLRQSLDLDENARGMKVFSPFNRGGLTVDGKPDQVVEPVSGGVENNWVMVSGPQGAIVLIFELSPMKNSKKLFYFYDNGDSGKGGDGTADTGDGKSIGDSGIMVKATGSALIADKLIVNYKAYFVTEPNLDADFGERIVRWDQNPLKLTTREQRYVPSTTKRRFLTPRGFRLLPAYPNPFNPKQMKSVRFEFEAPPGEHRLLLFNVLGQQAAVFSGVAAEDGRGAILWDGRQADGTPFPPGVYFLQFSEGADLRTEKLIIN